MSIWRTNCWLTHRPQQSQRSQESRSALITTRKTHTEYTQYTHTHTENTNMCAHTSFVNFSILQHVCQTRHEGSRELFECAYESTHTHTHICVYDCMEAIVSTCQRLKSQWTNDDRTRWSRMETEFESDSESNFQIGLRRMHNTRTHTHSYTPVTHL